MSELDLLPNEQAQQIKDYPNYYITTLGRVWSTHTNKWLKPIEQIRGAHKRLYVSLGKGNKCYIHRLVAETFIPNPNNLPEVDHKDTNGLNNAVNNLQWCTHDTNMANEITMNAIKQNTGYYIELEEIATGKKFIGYDEASNYSGLSKQALLNHVKGRVKKPRWRLTGQRFRENNLEKPIDKSIEL